MDKSVLKSTYRGWAYAEAGDYHRNMRDDDPYTLTYNQKMRIVKSYVRSLPRSTRILDAGCGEGVLVEEFLNDGYNIGGLDLNYESDHVQKGDIRRTPYDSASYDVVLLLDTFEHLHFEDQLKALTEISRILSSNGCLVMSVPNLAHINSRYLFFRKGSLHRTDVEVNHVGERPYSENYRLLKQARFNPVKRMGLTLSIPYIYPALICKRPVKYRWLHDGLEPIARKYPSLAMFTIFFCQKVG